MWAHISPMIQNMLMSNGFRTPEHFKLIQLESGHLFLMSECFGHVCCKYYVRNLCKLNRQQNSNAAGMDFSTILKYNSKYPFIKHVLY